MVETKKVPKLQFDSTKDDDSNCKKLRFSDFNSEWKTYKLKDIGKINTGNTPSTKISEYYYPEKYLWVTPTDITTKYIKNTERKLSEKGAEKGRFVKKNSVLVTCIASIGKNCIILEDGYFNQQINSITPLTNFDLNFIYYLMEHNSEKMKRYAGITATPILNKKSFENMEFKLPLLDEQKKIGAIISSVDQKIELIIRKLNQTIKFKQFLLQQLFANKSSESNELHKLRFDFHEEVEKFNLGEISEIKKGFTPSTSNPSFWDGDINWVAISDMSQGKYISSTKKKITSKGAKNKKIIKKGTLLMSFKLTIGKLGILTEDMYTNEAICNFNWLNDDISTEYMYYYLNSINIKKYGSQAAKGITLNNDTLNKIPVLIPSIEEQEKITNFLSSVDQKIDLINQQLDQTTKFKQFLLQHLFV